MKVDKEVQEVFNRLMGMRVKRVREEKGIGNEEVARKMKRSVGHYNKMEQGEVALSAYYMAKLKLILGLDDTEFLQFFEGVDKPIDDLDYDLYLEQKKIRKIKKERRG